MDPGRGAGQARSALGSRPVGPSPRRLFVAVPVPAEASASVASLVEAVRADGVPSGGRDVRWVRLDGLHLTVRFLGPVAESRIEAALDAVRAAAAESQAFDVVISGAGAFPPSGRPRALWLGIRQGAEELGALAATTDRCLASRGWDGGGRPYRAHLTLARSDGVASGGAIAARLQALAADVEIAFRAGSVGLFESLTGGGPARYVPLGMAPLG